MKKRWIAVFIVTLLVIGGVLTGCASNKPVDTTTTDPQTPAPASESPMQSADQSPSAPQQSVQPDNSPVNTISQDEAKQIALKDAGVAEADVTGLRVKEDRDDGRYIYEVQFYVQNKEYDYDIDATSGAIVSSDYDVENNFNNNGSSPQNSGQTISEEDARNAALGRVPGATQNDIRIHLDTDDGKQVYEGDIYYNNTEYEFQIDATTGEFIEWSQESR